MNKGGEKMSNGVYETPGWLREKLSLRLDASLCGEWVPQFNHRADESRVNAGCQCQPQLNVMGWGGGLIRQGVL